MPTLMHVTSVLNRDSVSKHGLAWTRMGSARGIAGSRTPEVAGVFLDTDRDFGFFVRMNNTGGPVDVWAADGIDEAELLTSPDGFRYLPRRIPAAQLRLVHRDIGPARRDELDGTGSSRAHRSELTVWLSDGRVLRGEDARQLLRQAQDRRDQSGETNEPS